MVHPTMPRLTTAAIFTVHVVVGIDPRVAVHISPDLYVAGNGRRTSGLRFSVIPSSTGSRSAGPKRQARSKPVLVRSQERRQRERKAYVARAQFPTRGDKSVRAQSIRGRMAMDGLYVPINAPWYQALRSELLSFPAGKHDDQVDALGLIGQILDRMSAGQKRPEKQPMRGMTEMTLQELLDAQPKRTADARI